MHCPYVKTNVRKEILLFANQMEEVMRTHDKTKGDSWKTVDIEYLWRKLDEEYREAAKRVFAKELLDLAIVCMMLFWRLHVEVNWNLGEKEGA